MASNKPVERRRVMERVAFGKGLRGTLLLWFLLLALIPMGIMSMVSYMKARQALTTAAIEKLTAVRKINETILSELFSKWESDARFISERERVKSDMVDMAAGFNFLGPDRLRALYSEKSGLSNAEDGSAYSVVHDEEHRFFVDFMESTKYEDVFLIDRNGNVIYTYRKGPDFAASLESESLESTNLAALYRSLKKAKPDQVRVVDVKPYVDDVAMFMGTPVSREDTVLGFLVFRLSLLKISERIQIRAGMGETGETYLVGPDFRMRSDSLNDPVNRSVGASFAGPVATGGVETRAVRDALDGREGVGIIEDYRGVEVLSSWAPVDLKDLNWVIATEMDVDEAMAPVAELGKITVVILVFVVLATVLFSLYASGRIVSPVRKLTDWARKVAAGDLSIVDVPTPENEIGILNNGIRAAVLSLKMAREEEERRNWIKTGMGDLDDAMRGQQEVEVLSRTVVTFIAKYIKAQVGAIFTLEEDGAFRLKASYAYKTRKNLSNAFQAGEGLVGQAALEKQSILLTQVPEDYVTVTSGLGEKPPRNIFVIPLVVSDETMGVMEFGALEPFSEDQRNLLEEVAERIAIALNLARSRQELGRALEKTQRQAEELQTQQEELKTANEELEEQTRALRESEERLKAQQEELQVTNEELEEKTDLLQQQKRDIEKANRDLEQAGVDIEERAEELALASKYKSEFLANMSHELRTPLNSLLLLSDTLSENKTGNLTEDQQQSVTVIRDSGTQLLSLINEILDLSKIEAGRMELHREKVAVRDLGERVENHFLHMAEDKGLAMSVAVDSSAPAEIDTDVGRAEQIIRNLVTNAIKFTESGTVEVSFSRPDKSAKLKKSNLDPAKTLAVSVKDTGIGIPPDRQKIIFEAFQQVDGGTARRYGGTGLGLSISKELAHLMGGEIQLQSEPGEGSTFTLYLPEQLPKQKPGATKTKGDSAVSPSSPVPTGISTPRVAPSAGPPAAAVPDDRDNIAQGERAILIVEDDARFARLLQEECRSRGFKSIVAGTGEEGLNLAAFHAPAAIILDIRLPGMDGWSVLQQLKENPDLRHIPVHFMSVDEPSIEAFSRGAIGYLRKPTKREELEQAFGRIEDVVQRKIKNLLVVEDDDQMRKNIVQLIGNGDVHTEEASTGKDALEAIRGGRYDCVILDLGLPDMTGFEVLQTLQQEEAVTVPPVIVYTGRELNPAEVRELRQYSDSIIIKGVRSEERLLDEASLFLHRMVGKMPEKKQKIITDLHDKDVLFRGKTVLMVDDDMRNMFALSRILEEKGMNVVKAEDGKRALGVLEENPDVDLVLMDIMMPVMDGYEAMRRIRAQDRYRDLPIIALTAKAMAKDREQCIEAGASDYLAKPVDVQRLLSMMRVWLYR